MRITYVPAMGAAALLVSAGLSTLLAQEAPAPKSIEYGRLELVRCELREAQYDPPVPSHLQGRRGNDGKHAFGWESVVFGRNLPIRALDPVLWVDGTTSFDCFERKPMGDEEALVFHCFDPKLLRAEHRLEVIYGRDERTRTALLERLDPERLTPLPAPTRKALGMPTLESGTIATALPTGRVAGSATVSEGTLRLALRTDAGRLVLADVAPTLGTDGRFTAELGALSAGTTHVALLLFTRAASVKLGDATLSSLPAGVELLDAKPIAVRGGR